MVVTWYRTLFLTYFSWCRGWSANNKTAAGASCFLLFSLHCLNLIVVAEILRRATGVPVRLYDWIGKNSLFWIVGGLGYFWYFISRIDRWVGDDPVVAVSRSAQLSAWGYLGTTILAVIVLILV